MIHIPNEGNTNGEIEPCPCCGSYKIFCVGERYGQQVVCVNEECERFALVQMNIGHPLFKSIHKEILEESQEQ